jgi:8-oxo-dGTP diphosphatase
MKRVDVAIAIVCRQRKVLICRRRRQDHLGGFWEFPGGKLEAGETIQQCLARELREELDIAIEPITQLPMIEHDYPDVLVRLHPYICTHRAGEPKPIGCDELIWIDPNGLREYEFPPANKQLIEQLIERLTSCS